MKYKGIIFDLDGTLLDSLKGIGDSANLLLKKLGYNFEYQQKFYKNKVGEGLKELLAEIIPADHRKKYNFDELVTEYRNIYKVEWRLSTKPYAGIHKLLKLLNKKGIKMSILSNKSDDYVKLMVSELLKDIQFVSVRGVIAGKAKKPDPATALEIAKTMNINCQEIIFVGDTAIDIQTAHRAGMKSMGVLWGFRPKTEFIENNADMIVNQPRDIDKFF